MAGYVVNQAEISPDRMRPGARPRRRLRRWTERRGAFSCLARNGQNKPLRFLKPGGGSCMLKGISPVLNADVLHALAAMGHGDMLVIVDSNFPAESIALETHLGHLLRIDNVTAPQAAAAILSLLPLDSFIDDAATRMEVVGSPDELPAVQNEMQAEIDRAEGKHWPLVPVERFAFYERAKSAFCVIQTGERRFYGCFTLTKGVIPPDAA
jgi:L-fucose mutarotase